MLWILVYIYTVNVGVSYNIYCDCKLRFISCLCCCNIKMANLRPCVVSKALFSGLQNIVQPPISVCWLYLVGMLVVWLTVAIDFCFGTFYKLHTDSNLFRNVRRECAIYSYIILPHCLNTHRTHAVCVDVVDVREFYIRSCHFSTCSYILFPQSLIEPPYPSIQTKYLRAQSMPGELDELSDRPPSHYNVHPLQVLGLPSHPTDKMVHSQSVHVNF